MRRHVFPGEGQRTDLDLLLLRSTHMILKEFHFMIRN